MFVTTTMKLRVYGLLLLLLIGIMTVIEAQELRTKEADSIKLKLLSFSNPRDASVLESWSLGQSGNVRLDRSVDGFRAAKGSAMQRGAIGSPDPDPRGSGEVSPTTRYPVKLQFLAVAKVPAGVTQVTWNLAGGSASIVGTPVGASLVNQHTAVTPVGLSQVGIENTHYVVKSSVSLARNWVDKLQPNRRNPSGIQRVPPPDAGESSKEYPSFYRRGLDDTEVEYQRKFNIGANETYVVITSTQLGQTDIVASCEGSHAGNSSVFATVEWVEQPPPIAPSDYDYVVQIVDRVDPIEMIDIPSDETVNVEFEVTITNRGVGLPKDLLAFRLYPDARGMDEKWWLPTPTNQWSAAFLDTDPPSIKSQDRATSTASRRSTGNFAQGLYDYTFLWSMLVDDGPADENKIPAGTGFSSTVRKAIFSFPIDRAILPGGIRSEHTELYFVGPTTPSSTTGDIRYTGQPTILDIPLGLAGLHATTDGQNASVWNQGLGLIKMVSVNADPDHILVNKSPVLNPNAIFNFTQGAGAQLIIEFEVVDPEAPTATGPISTVTVGQ